MDLELSAEKCGTSIKKGKTEKDFESKALLASLTFNCSTNHRTKLIFKKQNC